MKYARFSVLLSVLVSVLAAWFALAAAPAQWEVVIPPTNFADKMRVAAFFDGNLGFMGGAGDVGKAHYTSDGGKNWATADSSGG